MSVCVRVCVREKVHVFECVCLKDVNALGTGMIHHPH